MDIEEQLKKKKIKLTPARKSILDMLQNAKRPLSYEDIKDQLLMDKATFYRNIAKFEEEGLINAFESNNKKRHFELKANSHAHFVCLECNKIECIDELTINIDGYDVDNVILNGTCKECKG